jgi:hypothetical protein
MKVHLLSAHEQVILYKVRQRFAGVEVRASYANCATSDFAEVSIVALMEDKEVIEEYMAVVVCRRQTDRFQFDAGNC